MYSSVIFVCLFKHAVIYKLMNVLISFNNYVFIYLIIYLVLALTTLQSCH